MVRARRLTSGNPLKPSMSAGGEPSSDSTPRQDSNFDVESQSFADQSVLHQTAPPMASLSSSKTAVSTPSNPFETPNVEQPRRGSDKSQGETSNVSGLFDEKAGLPTLSPPLTSPRPPLERSDLSGSITHSASRAMDPEKNLPRDMVDPTKESKSQILSSLKRPRQNHHHHHHHDSHAQHDRDTGGQPGKSARFTTRDGSYNWSLKDAWHAVKSTLRNPSHPSSSSQLDSATGEDTISTRPRGNRSATGGNSSVGRASQAPYDEEDAIGASGNRGISEPVSVVAVESDLRQFVPAAKSDNGSAANTGDGQKSNRATGSHHQDTEGSTTQPSWVARMAHGGSHRSRRGDGGMDDGSSVRRDRRSNWFKRTWLYEMAAERTWPAVAHFCDSKFPEPSKERSFQKEVHFTLRRGAICASLCESPSNLCTIASQTHAKADFQRQSMLSLGYSPQLSSKNQSPSLVTMVIYSLPE